MQQYAIIDTETTGLPNCRHNRIIEIAVVRLTDNLEVVDEFETLLNPGRDLGPTRIHGIGARSVVSAPQFEDVAGDLLDRIHGCVLIAHNATFDAAFLRGEFGRIGVELPEIPTICTLNLSRKLGEGWLSFDLDSCCAALGIVKAESHRALSDARATTELFRALAYRCCPDQNITLDSLGCRGRLPWNIDSSALARSGRSWRREQASLELQGPDQYLSKLVYRLAGLIQTTEVSCELAGYLDALDRVLEDRVLTSEGASALFETAKLWNLRPEDVVEAHRLYVRRLATAAWADGKISDAELRDLTTVNELFGFDETFLRIALADAHSAHSKHPVETESLTGMSVCFTGECSCTVRGEIITRQFAYELASRAGLSVKSGVTKQLDVLVVADPYTLSGKAKKARDYGTRIIHEPVFWRMIGVSVD